MNISRRRFAHLLGVGAAAATLRPVLPNAAEGRETIAPAANSIVRLSSNENPYGPSAKGIAAMTNSYGIACRYPDGPAERLVDALAKLNGVASDEILLGDGSGEILKLCAATFTGRANNGGNLVVGDPTFEAILAHARVAGADVVKVPLKADYSHDLEKMGAAARAGVVYICNPNNPTASITPKNDLRDFIARTPQDTTILVDEAYFHYAKSPDYESVIPLVKDHPNLMVARTFSKIYGMAGLRCGYCVAQKPVIEKMRPHQPWDSINIMAIAAALASLGDAGQVENGRRMNAEAKAFTIAALDKMGYKTIPSEANFVMFDTRSSVTPMIKAMKEKNIEVGRLFPAMPNHMRLTIGKKSEMEAFLGAFKQVATA
jgi:histidinol-phosphate aminotransferase